MSTWERCLANWVSTLTKCLPRLPYRVFALDGCVHYRGVCLTIHECMPIRSVSALERCLHYRDVCLIGMASLQCWLLKKIIELCAIQSCLPRVSAFLTAFFLTYMGVLSKLSAKWRCTLTSSSLCPDDQQIKYKSLISSLIFKTIFCLSFGLQLLFTK